MNQTMIPFERLGVRLSGVIVLSYIGSNMDRNSDGLGRRDIEGAMRTTAIDGDGLADSFGHGLASLALTSKQLALVAISPGTFASVEHGSLLMVKEERGLVDLTGLTFARVMVQSRKNWDGPGRILDSRRYVHSRR